MKITKNTLVIGHIDLDGISPICLMNHFEINCADYLFLDYDWRERQEVINYMNTFDDIFFIDNSPNEEIYESLIEKGKKITVFDHHETSLWLKDKENCIIDMDRCGTKIFYEEYIKKNPLYKSKPILDYFVELVNAYDLWLLDSEYRSEAEDLNRLMYKYLIFNKEGQDKYIKWILHICEKLYQLDKWELLPKEKEIITKVKEYELKQYEALKKTIKIRFDKKGRKFAVGMLSTKISFCASRFLEENPDIYYILIINTFDMSKKKISGRTNKEEIHLIDDLGLSGHKQAAGYMFESDSLLTEFWNNEEACFPLD